MSSKKAVCRRQRALYVVVEVSSRNVFHGTWNACTMYDANHFLLFLLALKAKVTLKE